jgi:hypothetical protein
MIEKKLFGTIPSDLKKGLKRHVTWSFPRLSDTDRKSKVKKENRRKKFRLFIIP